MTTGGSAPARARARTSPLLRSPDRVGSGRIDSGLGRARSESRPCLVYAENAEKASDGMRPRRCEAVPTRRSAMRALLRRQEFAANFVPGKDRLQKCGPRPLPVMRQSPRLEPAGPAPRIVTSVKSRFNRAILRLQRGPSPALAPAFRILFQRLTESFSAPAPCRP